MKKLLVFLAMLGVMVGFVFGASQDIFVVVEGVVDFSVTPSLNFSSLTPGGAPGVAISTLTLGEDNTEDLFVDISLTEESNDLFENIVLTTDEPSIGGLGGGPSLADTVSITVDDTDETDDGVEQNKDITATLAVPAETLPGERTGTIMYIVTSPAP